jgi:hypothetical protein
MCCITNSTNNARGKQETGGREAGLVLVQPLGSQYDEHVLQSGDSVVVAVVFGLWVVVKTINLGHNKQIVATTQYE